MKKLLFTFLLIQSISLNVWSQQWELRKNKEGIKVYTQKNPNSPFDLLKADCEINVGIAPIIDLIFDVNKHSEWVYNSIESKVLKKISRFEIIYYGETYAPWPVSNRDLIIHLTAVTDSLTGICNIIAISEPNFRPAVEGKIRVPRSVSKWKLIPISEQSTRIIYTLDIDPGGSLPAWLVNYASVEGPYLSFLKMKDILVK